jgi:hypothetical protein
VIFTANHEFAGRISADSHDIFPERHTIEGEDDHGTMVAMVAAAANDSSGTVGIAYGATIMAIRADEPDTCAADDCSFGDVSDGINWAVDHGATVINISLGGANATPDEIDAVKNASAAGVVVVIAAGNSGGNRPDLFPRSLAALNLHNVMVVGSVDSDGTISSFTDKARGAQSQYISALGRNVRVDIGGQSFQISGTSFSAPQVAGAVALLKQAFPSLDGDEIVSLLFETAQDVGAAGVDDVYGWGILDIHEAFQPQGTLTLPGAGLAPLSLGDSGATGSPAMGDALTTASLHAVILDKYDRAFDYDLGATMRGAAIPRRLWGAVGNESRSLAMSRGMASFAFTVDRSARLRGSVPADELQLGMGDAERARVLAARVALKISPDTQFGFTYAESADGLIAQMQGQERPAFLIAQGPAGDDGIFRRTDASFALRRQFGRWGLTVSGDTGRAIGGENSELADRYRLRTSEGVHSFGLTFDRRFGALDTTLGFTWMGEDRTVLGARFHDSFGGGGADTVFADFGAGWGFAPRWRLGGAFRNGWTFAGNGVLIGGDSMLVSRAWSLDLERQGVLGGDDRLALRLAQPLRVEGGALDIRLPVAWSYDTLSPTLGTRALSLTPDGRELLGELAWRGRMLGGWGSASLFYRREPGHYAYVPDDAGVALRWSSAF